MYRKNHKTNCTTDTGEVHTYNQQMFSFSSVNIYRCLPAPKVRYTEKNDVKNSCIFTVNVRYFHRGCIKKNKEITEKIKESKHRMIAGSLLLISGRHPIYLGRHAAFSVYCFTRYCYTATPNFSMNTPKKSVYVPLKNREFFPHL